MSKSNELFASIDRIIDHVEAHKVEPLFSAEKLRRESLAVLPFVDNDMVLRTLATIIAYSQQAKSSVVRPLLESGVFDRAFKNFEVAALHDVNPCVFLDEHWPEIKGIRIKTKVFQLIMAARALAAVGPFADVLNDAKLPKRIKTPADVDAFWLGMGKLQKTLKPYDIPFMSSTTSLLHLLLHIGYDCVKPDLIVMRVAFKLGIVSDVTKDTSFKAVARTLQEYAVARGIRPSVVDLYFLIHEGQSDARQYVTPGFQPAYS
jgi:hypothetical protein